MFYMIGFGVGGNIGRCFGYLQDFTVCMKTSGSISNISIININVLFFCHENYLDDPMKMCGVLRDDYLECLHHRKESNYK